MGRSANSVVVVGPDYGQSSSPSPPSKNEGPGQPNRAPASGFSPMMLLLVLVLIMAAVAAVFYFSAERRGYELRVIRTTQLIDGMSEALERNVALVQIWRGRYGSTGPYRVRCRNAPDPEICRFRFFVNDPRNAYLLHSVQHSFVSLAACVQQDFCDWDTAVLYTKADVLSFSEIYYPSIRFDPPSEVPMLDDFIDRVSDYDAEQQEYLLGPSSVSPLSGPSSVSPDSPGGYAVQGGPPPPLTGGTTIQTTPDAGASLPQQPSFFDRMWYWMFGPPQHHHRHHYR